MLAEVIWLATTNTNWHLNISCPQLLTVGVYKFSPTLKEHLSDSGYLDFFFLFLFLSCQTTVSVPLYTYRFVKENSTMGRVCVTLVCV